MKQRLFVIAFCLTVLVLGIAEYATAAPILNGGFDLIGPNGPSVTNFAHTSDFSAALGWVQWALSSGSYVTTTLQASTDPLPGGGGNMIHYLSDGHSWPPDSMGNGFGQSFSSALLSATVTYDLYVVSGQVTGGLYNDLLLYGNGAFSDFSYTFGPTNGWIHVTETISHAVAGVAFETLTATGGAEYYIDNLRVTSAVPEPSTLLLFVSGFAGIGLLRKRLRS